MKITNQILEKYARLIVRTGANVQEGQVVLITASVEQWQFAGMVMEECYKAGAKKVNIDWSCDLQTRLNYLYADTDTLSEVLPWQKAKLQQMVDDLPCRIFIDSDDPDALAGIDPGKITDISRRRSPIIKPYRNAIDGKHQWLIVAVPSPAWARKCFPDAADDEEAVALLWEAVLKTVRVDETNDPVAVWKEHSDFMIAKSEWMMAQRFRYLKYHSANGTDFKVELNPEARWESAGMTNVTNGVFFIPNMPTEEVFTSPLVGSCEGTLVSTKPLSWNSQLIEDFSITFKDGKAVSCTARKGKDLLEQMLTLDAGACKLGEVALVPKESPVNQCGFLFYNTLFDENACCHCALGMGFKDLLPGGVDMSVEEALAHGCNDSMIHVDFMVGSDDLEIIGIRDDGSSEQIFRNGTWA